MRKTRASKGASAGAASSQAAATSSSSSTTSRHVLPPSTAPSSTPRLAVLPAAVCAETAQIVTLPGLRRAERGGGGTRYLVCPKSGGLFEFTKVAAPATEPRSWLVEMGGSGGGGSSASAAAAAAAVDGEDKAFTTPSADLFVATPLDPLFLVLPALWVGGSAARPPNASPDGRRRKDKNTAAGEGGGKPPRRLFLSAEDHIDNLVARGEEEAGRAKTQQAEEEEEERGEGGDAKGGSECHLPVVLARGAKLREALERRMAAVCDVLDLGGGGGVVGEEGGEEGGGGVGGEKMYRLNEARLLAAVLGKARRMTAGGGLPPSLEAALVRKPLELPVVGGTVVRKGSQGGEAAAAAVEVDAIGTPASTGSSGAAESQASTADGSSSLGSAAASFRSEASVASTAATSVAGDDVAAAALEKPGDALPPPLEGGGSLVQGQAQAAGAAVLGEQATAEVLQLQRTRVAFDMVCARYVPADLAAVLKRMLVEPPPAKSKAAAAGSKTKPAAAGGSSSPDGDGDGYVDFAPLEAHLARVADLKKKAQAAQNVAADYSRKRGLDDEDDERAEKKRRKEEEDKRKKAGETRGVRDLKKVNTSGMMKLSAFFKKV